MHYANPAFSILSQPVTPFTAALPYLLSYTYYYTMWVMCTLFSKYENGVPRRWKRKKWRREKNRFSSRIVLLWKWEDEDESSGQEVRKEESWATLLNVQYTPICE